MVELEKMEDKKFGDIENPLLVSVSCGARVSMSGMMDTVLNLGLNDDTVIGLAKLTDNEWFAYDSYRRFIQMFSDVVIGIEKNKFDVVFEEIQAKEGVTEVDHVSAEGLKQTVD